jgi:predicted lipoprotein with Yx(FWY)xxD motif
MTISRTKGPTYAVAAAALAAFVAGCGSSSSGGGGTQSVSAGSTSQTSGLTTQSTSIGTVVADANGHTVYELVGDPPSNTKCTGSCLSIWPAVTSGGKIVVVHGHPVFTFSGDSSTGDTRGQGIKDTWGLWLALDSKGQPIPNGGTAPTQSTGSGSGGYGY